MDLLSVLTLLGQILGFAILTWLFSTKVLPKIIELLHTGAIDKGVFSLLVLVMFGYILLTPMGITFAIRRLEHSEDVPPDGQIPPSFDRFALEGIRVRDILDRSRSYPEKSLTVKALSKAGRCPNSTSTWLSNTASWPE